jgi:hypothetical protein
MDDKKYRILYNEEQVVDVLEDYGTTYIGAGTNYMVMVDTKENAKVMLESVGINTDRLFNEFISDPEMSEPTGIDYLDSINDSFDPQNITGGII